MKFDKIAVTDVLGVYGYAMWSGQFKTGYIVLQGLLLDEILFSVPDSMRVIGR